MIDIFHNGLKKKIQGNADSEWTLWFRTRINSSGYGVPIPNGVNEILVEVGDNRLLCSSAVVYPKESYKASMPVLNSSKNILGIFSIEVNAAGELVFSQTVSGGMLEEEIPISVFL